MTTVGLSQGRQRGGRAAARSVALGAAIAASALVVSGCTTGGGTGGGGGEYSTDTIRTAMIADPNSFSPYDASGVSANSVSAMLYATLLYQDDDNTTTAGLASEYEIDPDGGVFTIRDNATCSDGSAITPTVVADSLETFVEESRQKEIVFGGATPEITADDEAGTVEISLDEPWADMERGLSLTETGIVCPAGLEDLEALSAGEIDGAYSGGYVLENNQPGVTIDFSLREEGYTFPEFAEPAEGVPAQTVKYAIMSDYNAMANGLLTDQLDYATLTGEAMERIDGEEDFETSTYAAATLFVIFNQRDGMPMANEDTRRAVAQALDRDAFNDAATDGRGDVLSSYVPSEVACAYTNDDSVIDQDVDAASDILNGVEINLTGTQAVGPNGAGNSYVSQALEAAGAEVDLNNVDNTTWATELQSKPEAWDATVMALLNMSRTQYGGLSQFTGSAPEDGGRNVTAATHEDVLEQVGEAMAEEDEATRCKIYEDIQTQLLGEAAFVPLSTLPAQPTTADGFSVRQINGTVSTMSLRITG